MVVAETEIVINCAASVNFDDPLLDALQINYFGSLRMLALASECVNIKCFCNVSTAYSNSNYIGNNYIEEKIYDLESGVDPEEVVQKILNMGPLLVKEKEQEILGNYPNTYTFSKSMTERVIKKKCGKIPTTIIRPSIIISCYDEPFQGWTDTLSAGGGLTYSVSIGAIKYLNSDANIIYDIIPCDFVTNLIIAQVVHHSTMREQDLQIAHISSGNLNPFLLGDVQNLVHAYQKYNPFYRYAAPA
jgi:nucleoside-diphosphate-sugar epimerase